MAEQAFGDGGGDRDLASLEVGLGLAHDCVGHLGVVLDILDGHLVHELHLIGLQLALVDDASRCNQILEFRNLSLQHSLTLLGGVIFCVLREVAFLACLLDSLDNIGALHVFQTVELGHFLVVAFLSHVANSHGKNCLVISKNKKNLIKV